MTNSNKKIYGGLYLVVDPAPGLTTVLPVVKQALAGGIDVIQIWNNWGEGQHQTDFIEAICQAARSYNVPVLINEAWELLLTTRLDGVHFDALPQNMETIRQAAGRPIFCGLTCGNDLSRVQWAHQNRIDYISFCSLFPSTSAGACEIVTKETVLQARRITDLPIFLAGGITLNNLPELTGTGMNGIALISAIMKADHPQSATTAFKKQLQNLTSHASITG